MCHVIFQVWGVSWRKILYFQWNISEKKNQTPVRGKTEKSQAPAGKISLETRNLSNCEKIVETVMVIKSTNINNTNNPIALHNWAQWTYKKPNNDISREKESNTGKREDGKISGTRGKDFVGDQKFFPWVSEIFPSYSLTGVWSFITRVTLRIYI
jgi:hypothetical protein